MDRPRQKDATPQLSPVSVDHTSAEDLTRASGGLHSSDKYLITRWQMTARVCSWHANIFYEVNYGMCTMRCSPIGFSVLFLVFASPSATFAALCQ